MDKININVSSENRELVIRKGDALPLKEPVEYIISGTISAPAVWFETKAIDKAKSYVVANKQEGKITLHVVHHDNYLDVIIGQFVKNEKLDDLGINSNKIYTSQELSQLLKFYRMYFPDKERHSKIIAELQNLKGQVVTNFEKTNDLKGNKKFLFEQELKKAFDLSFNLSIPIFADTSTFTFTVDVNYEVTNGDVRFWLESVELAEIKENYITQVFDEVIARFNNEITIIYK